MTPSGVEESVDVLGAAGVGEAQHGPFGLPQCWPFLPTGQLCLQRFDPQGGVANIVSTEALPQQSLLPHVDGHRPAASTESHRSNIGCHAVRVKQATMWRIAQAHSDIECTDSQIVGYAALRMIQSEHACWSIVSARHRQTRTFIPMRQTCLWHR